MTVCQKKKKLKTTQGNVNINIQEMQFPNF